MKITFEKLDKGYLVTAENDGQVERLAYDTGADAFQAVGDALGIETALPPVPAPVSRAPVAAAPAPDAEEANEPSYDNPPPPTTRRNGLIQPRKSAPPSGRSPRV